MLYTLQDYNDLCRINLLLEHKNVYSYKFYEDHSTHAVHEVDRDSLGKMIVTHVVKVGLLG